MKWSFALAAGLFGALAPGLAGGVEVSLAGRVDLRLISSDAEQVWLKAGLDKLRFQSDEEPLVVGAGLLEIGVRWAPTVSTHLTVAAYDEIGAVLDLTEAYVELAPVPRSALRLRARVGAFYPPGTLENQASAWTTPFTLSFSAIDSWYAEELRAIGAEVELQKMGRFASSSEDFALTLGAFRFNDPAGAILSWRGWALHDRQTGLFERLPLAPLPNFQEDGLYYPVQGAFDEPFVELDGRTGWYAGGEWKHLDRSVLRYLHYDNRGDPTVVENGQWAWLTRFDRVGWHFRVTRRTEVIAQALAGTTRMDGFEGPLVDNSFAAGSLLLTHGRERHRVSLRYDRFRVEDDDQTPLDPNEESGFAATGAYFYAPPAHWFPWLARGNLHWGGEILFVESRREARALLGDEELERETSVQMAVQWRYPD